MIRRAARIQGEELRQAIDVSRDIIHELGLEEDEVDLNDEETIEEDADHDALIDEEDDEVSKFIDLQREQWLKQLFDLQEAAADKITQVFEDWKTQWGEPTESEVHWWEHWTSECTAASKAQDQSRRGV